MTREASSTADQIAAYSLGGVKVLTGAAALAVGSPTGAQPLAEGVSGITGQALRDTGVVKDDGQGTAAMWASVGKVRDAYNALNAGDTDRAKALLREVLSDVDRNVKQPQAAAPPSPHEGKSGDALIASLRGPVGYIDGKPVG